MIVNQQALLELAPIKNMLPTKERLHGVSHGLSEAGYDIRLAEDLLFYSQEGERRISRDGHEHFGRFILASSMEEFQMPDTLIGIVHDKSTHIRNGLSVFNTVIECGWCGVLTLELCYHGEETLYIPKGSGIAQVIFHTVTVPTTYTGKYANQSAGVTPAIYE